MRNSCLAYFQYSNWIGSLRRDMISSEVKEARRKKKWFGSKRRGKKKMFGSGSSRGSCSPIMPLSAEQKQIVKDPTTEVNSNQKTAKTEASRITNGMKNIKEVKPFTPNFAFQPPQQCKNSNAQGRSARGHHSSFSHDAA